MIVQLVHLLYGASLMVLLWKVMKGIVGEAFGMLGKRQKRLSVLWS